MTSAAIVQKLWNYCNVLRDDGMSYGDYPSTSLRAGSEQLTYLLFLKMADERRSPPYNQPSAVKTTRRRRCQALQISPWTFGFQRKWHDTNVFVASSLFGGVPKKIVDLDGQ